MKTILSTLALAALSYAMEFQGCELKQLPDGASGSIRFFEHFDMQTRGDLVSLVAEVEGLENGTERGGAYSVRFTGYRDFAQSDIDGLNSGALTCEDLHENDADHSEHAIHAGPIITDSAGNGTLLIGDINQAGNTNYSRDDANGRLATVKSRHGSQACCIVDLAQH